MVPVQDHHTGNISVTVSDCTGSLLQDTCEYSQSSPQPKPPGFCGNTGHSPRATAPLTPQQPDRPCSDNSRKNQEDPSKGAWDTVQLLSPSTTAAPASNAGLGIQFKQPPSSDASGYALVHVRICLCMYVCMCVCVYIDVYACVCVCVKRPSFSNAAGYAVVHVRMYIYRCVCVCVCVWNKWNKTLFF